MPTLSTLVLKLTGDNTGLVDSLRGAEGETETFGGKMSNIMAGVGQAMAGLAIGGAVALGSFLVGAVQSASEAEDALAQLEAVIKSTGGVAGMTAEELTGLAGAFQKTTKFGEEAVMGAQSILLTFTGIGKDVFPEVTAMTLDMAQALGTDAKSAAMQLGKALNDPVAGLSALSRSGVSFTEEQKTMIKTMVEAGDVAGAQGVILAELSREFGGSAVAAGATFSGQLEIAKNMLGEFGEMVGGKILPVLTPLIGQFITFATAALPQVEAALNTVLPIIGTALSSAINTIVGLLPTLGATSTDVFGVVGTVVAIAGGFITGTLVPAVQAVIAVVVAEWPKIQTTIQNVIDYVVKNVLPIAIKEINGLKEVITVLVDWVVANWPLILATIKRVVEAVSNIIQVAMPIIRDIFETVFPAIVAVVKLAIGTVLDVVKVAMQLINGDTTGALDTLKGIFTRIWDAIKGVVIAAGTAVLNAIKKPINDAIDWVTSMGDKLKNIGASIILGIRDGILSAPGAILSALSDIVNGAIDSIKRTLGIHSPSVLFAGIGANMMAGLARGIAGAGDLPTVQLNGVVNGLSVQGAGLGGAKVSAGGVGAGNTNNRQTSTVQNNYFTINTKDDASAIAGEMKRELRIQQAMAVAS